MTMQSVSLSALEASAANPRRKIDRKTIEGLAASIRTDGLLHNLVVSPVKGQKGSNGKSQRFQIVSGARRFHALKLLEDRGELPEDFTVAVEVRDDLSKDQTLRIATVENLQRQNMTPLEEAAALTKLVHKGVTLDDVVAQTGLSATTIKRRLALNSLCREAKAGLTKGEITLSQAEALTLGSDESQRLILERIEGGYDDSAEDIKATMIDDRPTVALAIFPAENYTGTITTDLFAADETSYFDDAAQFLALQKEAVAQLVKHHEASAAWVELTESHHIPDWQYRKASKRQKGGVLVNLSPSGRVEIREGLAKRSIDKHTAAQTQDHPAAPQKRKAAYSSALCAHIAHHKTAAVQEMLLASPRKVREVSVVERLMKFKPHEAIPSLAKESEAQSAYAVLEGQARQFATKLGCAIEEGEPAWKQLRSPDADDLTVYEAVRGLSDHDLDQLERLLIVLTFGQGDCQRLDSRDSLFNRVARDLSVDMRNHWTPDRSFLERRTRDQLVAIAADCGYAEGAGQVSSYKKADLVNCLIRHFQSAKTAAAPTSAQTKTRAWLPEAMLFPAVDADAPAETEDEAESVEEVSDED